MAISNTAILNHLQASSLLVVQEWAKVLWVKAVVGGRVICRFVSKKIGATMNYFEEMQQEISEVGNSLDYAKSIIDGWVSKYGWAWYQSLKIVNKGNGGAVLYSPVTNWEVITLHTAFGTPEQMQAKGFKPFSIGSLRGEEGCYWIR